MSLVSPNRSMNSFCRSNYQTCQLECTPKIIEQYLLRNEYPQLHYSRYEALNFKSLDKHQTIEIRLKHGNLLILNM